MPIVSVTRLRLRSLRFFPGFLWYTRRSIRQAKRTPGNLGVRVRKTRGLAFWTLSIWRDNQAIRAFVPASPHKEAMQKLPHWCDEAAFADWEQDTADWPSWETASEKLVATGRLVDVLHPSERQKAGVIELFEVFQWFQPFDRFPPFKSIQPKAVQRFNRSTVQER